MSVLFMDSAAGNDGATKWDVYTVSSVQAGISPSGRPAYRFLSNNSNVTLTKNIAPAASVVMGCYCRMSNISASDNVAGVGLMRVFTDTGATLHMSLTILSDGSMRLRMGQGNGAVIATSSAGVFSAATWHHLELRAEIHDSTGRIELWVDGVRVINFTGDTRNGGTSMNIDRVQWFRVSAAGSAFQQDMSDFVVSAQATPNGVTTVGHLLPNGPGNTTGLSQNPGTGSNWEKVDEATPNGDTDYVFSDTEGDYDLYTLTNLPASPSGAWDVLAVQTVFNAKASDGGPKYVRPVIRSGGSQATGTSQLLSASYLSRMQVFELNPTGTPHTWDEGEVNGLEVGPEVRDS